MRHPTLKSIKWALVEIGSPPVYMHQLKRVEVEQWMNRNLRPERRIQVFNLARKRDEELANAKNQEG